MPQKLNIDYKIIIITEYTMFSRIFLKNIPTVIQQHVILVERYGINHV